jgi:uridine monophosphate synthetase
MQPFLFDLICGVPYTALPFATAISLERSIPMVMRRKEKKEHGTAQMIEGVYHANQRCLIIEDVITSGASIAETADNLSMARLIVENAVVLIDRMQGGAWSLQRRGITVRSIFTLHQIMQILWEENRIDSDTIGRIQTFVRENQTC